MSGKRAKVLRKKSKISKKTAITALGICLCGTPAIAESNFLISVYPHYSLPVTSFSKEMEGGVGVGAKFTYRPIKYFDLYLTGDYQSFGFNTADSINKFNIVDGGVGIGYRLPMSSRFSMNLDAEVGYYQGTYNSTGGAKHARGLNVGGSISFSYKLNPVISTDVDTKAKHYMAQANLLTGAQISPGLTVNLTQAFRNSTNIEMEEESLDPVFPVLYSWYENNPFGKVKITNKEDAVITDVKVSFYQPQYMGHPNECGRIKSLEIDESFEVDLTAFFSEQMLELIEKTDTQANIIVEYKYLGQKKTDSNVMIVPVYGRNNMSWADDRCASVFVSSKDPAALWFAKYITSVVRDNVRTGVALNIQYAMGIFESLDQFGLNYVIDPTSAFADNVGSASIDFLQFPYQTLMYRGGDCDDISILVSSLFEAIGIDTAFITIPGHIFMAFDSGLTVEEAKKQFTSLDDLIIDGDEVWVPLEITLTDEGFNKAWKVGAREWNQAAKQNTAALYKMRDSWQIYRPVSVPGATARFTLPDEKIVGKLFSHSVDDYILRQIQPQIVAFEQKLKTEKTAENYNDFGVLYARYGLFAKAEAQFKNARRLDYLPAILNTANLYYSMKDFGRADQWYREVLNRDEGNIYAILGIARCAYETGEYDVCDEYYGIVYKRDYKLASDFAYLGSFEASKGRSFTLADRLMNTVWIDSPKFKKLIAKDQKITVIKKANSKIEVPGIEIKEEDLNPAKTDLVVKAEPIIPEEDFILPDLFTNGMVLVPDSEIKEEQIEESDLDYSILEGGDGDKSKISEEEDFEPAMKVERKYKGILAQLEFEIMTQEELVEAANIIPVVAEIEVPEEKIASVQKSEIVADKKEATHESYSGLEKNFADSEDNQLELAEETEEAEARKAKLTDAWAKLADKEETVKTDVRVTSTEKLEVVADKAIAEKISDEKTGTESNIEADTKFNAEVKPEENITEKLAEKTEEIAEKPVVAINEKTDVENKSETTETVKATESVKSIEIAEKLEDKSELIAEKTTEKIEEKFGEENKPEIAKVDADINKIEVKPAETVVTEKFVETVAVEKAVTDITKVIDKLEDKENNKLENIAEIKEIENPVKETEKFVAVETTESKDTLVEDISVKEITEKEASVIEPELEIKAEEKIVENKSEESVQKVEIEEKIETVQIAEKAEDLQNENSLEEIKEEKPAGIVNRAVPRFTKQPSEEWAPEEAYNVEIIPGMRTFEEEMGEYSNDKAYLYQEEFAFAVTPDEDKNDETEDLDTANSQLIALSSIPDVNPFASFLSEEDTKVVEEITNYSITEIRKELEEQIEELSGKTTEKTEEKNSDETVKFEKTPAVLKQDEKKEVAVIETKTEAKVQPVVEVKENSVTENSEADTKVQNVEKSEEKQIKTESTENTKSIAKIEESAVEQKISIEQKSSIEHKLIEESLIENEIKNNSDSEQELKEAEAEKPVKGKGLLALILSLTAGGGIAAGAGVAAAKKKSMKLSEKEGEE